MPQDEIDIIEENEVKFFVFAANDQWGFYVIPIMRQNDVLWLGKDEFYEFENQNWEMNFFDGSK